MKSALFKLLVASPVLLSIYVSQGYTGLGNGEKDDLDKSCKTMSTHTNNSLIADINQLPFELWKHIISFVDTSQLKNLSPVSQAFSYIIQTNTTRPLALVLKSESDFMLYLSHTVDYAPRRIEIQFMIDRIDLFIHSKLANIVSLYFSSKKTGDKGIGATGIRALAAGQWPNLTFLDLNDNDIGDGEVEDLTNGQWPNLAILNLKNNKINANGARALAAGPWLNLTSLDLDSNRVGNDGAKALAVGQWSNLTVLNLRNNRINCIGAKALAAGQWPSLVSLNLNKNQISDSGAEAIAAGQWPNLISLHLSINPIHDIGAKALTAGRWPALKYLTIRRNGRISTKAEHLLESKV